MQVVIVDDDPAARRTLREYCEREADLQVIGEYGDGGSVLAALQKSSPDLLFLDVRLEASNGLQLARALDPANLPLIVVVTAYEQYAVDAFEAEAVDYLLKPFDGERFGRALDRIRSRRECLNAVERLEALGSLAAQLERGRVAAETRTQLLAERGGHLHVLYVGQIEALEANCNYVKLIVGRDVYNARSTLQQAERALQGQPMLRLSRSCVVNMNHVREVSRTPRGDFILMLEGGRALTSSEGFRDPVREYLERLRVRSS